ncbi:UDP-glycosyltransferase 73C25-like [Actinidia eriantha]|uniref:UDP-glycosyltransferase 73C25-like n=1 Tax=Actinidia eriantha TaxID=165200 RepID=UPI00258F1761|nr:UDP-glycosyltransferase 73C25-like [Actinidia eriantha]XP_057504794.1 UDP-glycosyltransferase 73C25-like [Actinidia eriantha]
MGFLPVIVCKAAGMCGPCIWAMLDSDTINLPEVQVPFAVTRVNLPGSLRVGNAEDPWLQFMAEVGEADAENCGIIVNSFEEFEGEYVAILEPFFKKKGHAWCVGPLLLVNEVAIHDEAQLCPYIKLLSKQSDSNTVIYVGTQALLSATQMD